MTRAASTCIRVASLALPAVVAVLSATDMLGMEMGGGSLTGPLARMCLGGGATFAIGAALALVRWPLVIWVGGVATALSLPLYLDLLAPTWFAHLSSSPSSVVVPGGLVFNGEALLGLFSIVAAALVFGATSDRAGLRRSTG